MRWVLVKLVPRLGKQVIFIQARWVRVVNRKMKWTVRNLGDQHTHGLRMVRHLVNQRKTLRIPDNIGVLIASHFKVSWGNILESVVCRHDNVHEVGPNVSLWTVSFRGVEPLKRSHIEHEGGAASLRLHCGVLEPLPFVCGLWLVQIDF